MTNDEWILFVSAHNSLKSPIFDQCLFLYLIAECYAINCSLFSFVILSCRLTNSIFLFLFTLSPSEIYVCVCLSFIILSTVYHIYFFPTSIIIHLSYIYMSRQKEGRETKREHITRYGVRTSNYNQAQLFLFWCGDKCSHC